MQTLFALIKSLSLQSVYPSQLQPYIGLNKMKTIMKTKMTLMTALIVTSSLVSFAGKDEPRKTGVAVIPVKSSPIFKVIYKGESTGTVKLSIYNAKGALVFKETINGIDGFLCPLNFSGLDSGDYVIELVDSTGKKAEKVTYQAK
jgi:hypothetical protein